MLKNVYIKLTKYGPNVGPFNIYDQWGNLIAENVTKKELVDGVGYLLAEGVTMIKLVSVGDCPYEKTMPIVQMTDKEFFQTESVEVTTGCVWKHLEAPTVYNTYYGNIEPYMIEYPLAYEYFDQITQSVKDYSRVYRYLSNTEGVPSPVEKIEVDDEYFNKAWIYDGNQCSGLLELVKKPRRNLKDYMTYPIFNSDSKTITYTKSDGFYQYNTFWNLVKDKLSQLFIRSCESLSIDKELNQENMDYGKKSFTKTPIRGKEVRVRHILDDKGDLHIVSRIFFNSNQISYK